MQEQQQQQQQQPPPDLSQGKMLQLQLFPLYYDKLAQIKVPLLETVPIAFKVCNTCGTSDDGTELLQCSICKTTNYCNRKCQKTHWKVHKALCYPPATANGNNNPLLLLLLPNFLEDSLHWAMIHNDALTEATRLAILQPNLNERDHILIVRSHYQPTTSPHSARFPISSIKLGKPKDLYTLFKSQTMEDTARMIADERRSATDAGRKVAFCLSVLTCKAAQPGGKKGRIVRLLPVLGKMAKPGFKFEGKKYNDGFKWRKMLKEVTRMGVQVEGGKRIDVE